MPKVKLGDTIVEVVFAITVFALVAVISIGLMNSGIASAQTTLEITMARNEIDAQAEALRFVHNAFLFERESSNEELGVAPEDRTSIKWYAELWRMLTRSADDPTVANGLANSPDKIAPFTIDSCNVAYNGATSSPSIFENRAFVLNTRMLTPNTSVSHGNDQVVYTTQKHPQSFVETPLYPRIIFSLKSDIPIPNPTESSDEMLESAQYRFISRVEGIWVISVRDAAHEVPEFFDFHIRTCWYAPGRAVPTTIGTIIRLYNPEYVEASR